MSPRLGYLIFSVNSFIAAMLALYISFSIGLPRPFWAMLTVYITAQPLTGALRSKAVYRVIGTVAGGIAAIVIVPTFVNTPLAMALVLAAWSGLCLYVSLLDRTPRAYVFMLAGYTAAIIGFPSVTAPEAVFDTALARVEEITLGIGCATLVHTIIFPKDVGQVLNARIRAFLKDAQGWIGDALANRRTPQERDERRRLATDITELHVASSHLPFDTSSLSMRIGAVRALENRLAYTLPLISAIEDRLSQLPSRPATLARLIDDIVVWAEAEDIPDRQRGDAERLQRRCADLLAQNAADPVTWDTLLINSLLLRLPELIQALQDSRDLADTMGAPTRAPSPRVAALMRRSTRRRLHLDRGMAALSGLALMAAVMLCCTFWIFTAWPEGAVAATMAAVFSSFFAAQDDPAPAIAGFLIWSLAALPLAALYLFAILPSLDGFPMLALALAPALILIGYLQATPSWTPRAIALLIGFAGALGLQATFSADLPQFLNGNLAQIVGVGAALAATRLFRSVGAGWAARRILKRGWRDLAALARSRSPVSADAWIATMLDRVGLVTARIALAAPEDDIDAYDALADMRVGLNVIDLHEVAAAGGADAASVNTALNGVAVLFERRLSSHDEALGDPALMRSIDQAIANLASIPAPGGHQRGYAALVGLRRNLFPQAAPYSPSEAAAA
jgi:uncharacterized membrane protein YccC